MRRYEYSYSCTNYDMMVLVPNRLKPNGTIDLASVCPSGKSRSYHNLKSIQAKPVKLGMRIQGNKEILHVNILFC